MTAAQGQKPVNGSVGKHNRQKVRPIINCKNNSCCGDG
jgi:hypothetical protein